MVKRANTQEALAYIGSTACKNITDWLISLIMEKPVHNWDALRGTVVKNDKLEVRIDIQGTFKDRTHDERWINIQLQWRDMTLVTVMVQRGAITNNYIKTRGICDCLKTGMIVGIETQTIFIGNTQWLTKDNNWSGKQNLSSRQIGAATYRGKPEEIPRENIRLASELRDQALEGPNPRSQRLPFPPNEE